MHTVLSVVFFSLGNCNRHDPMSVQVNSTSYAEKKTLSKSAWIKEKSYTFTTSVSLLRDNQFYFLFFESFSYTSVLWLMNLKISIDSPLLKLTKLKKKNTDKI